MSEVDLTPETWAAWLALDAPPRPVPTAPVAPEPAPPAPAVEAPEPAPWRASVPPVRDLPSPWPYVAKAAGVVVAFGAGMWGVWAGMAWLRALAHGDATFPAAVILAVVAIVAVLLGCAGLVARKPCPGVHCGGCPDNAT